jgi:hypothetical protein
MLWHTREAFPKHAPPASTSAAAVEPTNVMEGTYVLDATEVMISTGKRGFHRNGPRRQRGEVLRGTGD